MKFRFRWVSVALLAYALSPFVAHADTPGDHPAYLHAMSELRAARWMIEHRPGDWATSEDEHEAVRLIDVTLRDLRQASIDDGKDLNFHPQIEEVPDHIGRLRRAVEYLERARRDINKEEDNAFANGLRNRSFGTIDRAIRVTRHAIHD